VCVPIHLLLLMYEKITFTWHEHSNYSCFTSGDFIREVHHAPIGSPPCSELARRPCVRPSPTPFLEVQVRINGQNTVQISESHGVRHILWKHRYIVKFRWWTSEVHLMNIWSFTNKKFKHHTCSVWFNSSVIWDTNLTGNNLTHKNEKEAVLDGRHGSSLVS
jgi:hypothetical protein